ncbi:MAG: YegS/Rv2252/BmrU family lipid kinase [Clostridia bacterium]|nr:YegS/Rv2252/BmrU family lipid kinase [Clostridia bacterium]
MKNVFIIVNPVSGTLKTRDSLFQIIDRLTSADVLPPVMCTKRRGHAPKLAIEAAKSGKYCAVIVIGGDGTLNEVNTGLTLSGVSIPVGYIPAGTTNDFATGLGLETELPAAAADIGEALKTGRKLELDIGMFGSSKTFSYIASFGAFAASSYNTPQNVKNTFGHFAYVLQGIGDFFQIKPIHTICEANGIRYEGDYIFGGVCNTFSVGKIVRLDETVVNLSDGLFEVVLVKNPADITEFNTLLSDLLASNIDSEMMTFIRTSDITFRLPAGTDWTLDGEKAENVSDVHIKVLPKSLKILTAKAGKHQAELHGAH